MAVVTTDFLQAILNNYRALFSTDFQAAAANQDWRDLAAQIPSATGENSYNWFGTVPHMQDVTERQVARQGLPAYSFSLKNREWQSVLEVERAALERDQLGLITPRVGQMAQEAARHPGELILMIVERNPGLTWTNSAEESLELGPYFSNGRSLGNSGPIDNLLEGSGVTIDNIQSDLGRARTTMRMFRDDNGRPENRIPNIIMVHPSLEQRMYHALNAQLGTLGAMPVLPANGNPSGAGYRVIVNPYLEDEESWYVFHSSGAVNKPFIFQVEKNPELTASTNPNEQAVIESRKFLYSAYARYNAGISDPRFAVKIEN